MSVEVSLRHLGGVATRGQLVWATSRAEVDRAIAAGEILAVARGRYALRDADEARVASHRLSGVLSHQSAALHHGWAVALTPPGPHVTLPKNRVLRPGQARGVLVHRSALGPDDVRDGVTTPERTLLDCLRGADFRDALAVADSALREGFDPALLRAIARDARGPGARQVRRVAGLADGRAANGFESALRAVAVDVPGLAVTPQVSLRSRGVFLGRPDLVDERLGIVLEADSFAWHGDRRALRRDARRYTLFTVHGWMVLRFVWEDVMFHAHEVAQSLALAVAERTQRRCDCPLAA